MRASPILLLSSFVAFLQESDYQVLAATPPKPGGILQQEQHEEFCLLPSISTKSASDHSTTTCGSTAATFTTTRRSHSTSELLLPVEHHQQRQRRRRQQQLEEDRPFYDETINMQPIQSNPVPSSSRRRRRRRRKKKPVVVFVVFLATLTGVSDVITSNLYNSFPNMMTGNTIRFSAALSKGDWDDSLYFGSLILGYGTGASLFRLLEGLTPATAAAANPTITTSVSPSSTDDPASTKELQSTDRTLSIVAVMSPILFGVADVLAPFFPQRYMLPLLSVGFGLIQAAALNALNGTVTNAATGHYTKIGLGIVDQLVISLFGGGRNEKGVGLAKCRTSIIFVFTFISSLALTNVAFRWFNRHPASAAYLPPLGITFGVLYALLLGWYSAPTALQ